MEITEKEIPVPWGHVAAKIWGSVEKPIILCFHGVMDNAGSFNRLIPLLSTAYCYVCIDLPSHGKSSHFPPHLPLYTLNNIPVYTIIMNFFKQQSYTILGHSYGGQIALLYARLYPERVQRLILLDTIHMFPVSIKYFQDYFVDKFDDYLLTDKKLSTNSFPTYTYDEALAKVRNRRNNNILSTEAAKALLERLLVPVGEGRYRLSVDQRLKSFINPIHDFRYILESFKEVPITCPVILILGKDSREQQMYMRGILRYFGKRRNIIIKQVDGDHDVHNNTPEVVAPHIIKFLTKSKL